MSEPDGQSLIRQIFSKYGVQKCWHPSKFRIGPDTTKSFRELPKIDLTTSAGDLCFIDIGPVIDGHEADFGQTIVVGSKRPHPLIQACEKVFQKTAGAWKSEKLTGQDLFEFANTEAKTRGYQLNPSMAGHRLGDFPHHLFSKEKLFRWEFSPSPNLWILEIHLVDAANVRGAFFEDLLS